MILFSYFDLDMIQQKDTTSLPYFRVKLSCVCLMFAYRKKLAYSYPKVPYSCHKVTYSYPRVTYSDPKVTCSDPKMTYS